MNTATRSLAAVGALALAGLSSGPASAEIVEHFHVVESDSQPFDFCPGITATQSYEDHVHVLARSTGPDGLVRYNVNVRGKTWYTNLVTGGAYTNTYSFTDHDLKVLDNGDGTLTITVANTGSFKWFDADGNRVLSGAGLFEFTIDVDHGGTPTDPSDDTEIEDSFVLLKDVGPDQTTGRDFCEDLALFT
jgi:hypothetical protein